MILTFNVSQNGELTRTDSNRFMSDTIGEINCSFTFPATWTGAKTAIFSSSALTTPVHAVLVGDSVLVPDAVMVAVGWFTVSVYCGNLKTANAVSVGMVLSGYVSSVPAPAPSVTQTYVQTYTDETGVQLMRIVNDIVEFYDGSAWVVMFSAEEAARVIAEGQRVSAEDARVIAEGLRAQGEIDRDNAYGLAETARDGLYAATEGARDLLYVGREDDRDDLYDAAEAARSGAVAEYLKIYGNRYVRSLGNRLTIGIEPACILLQGDSTGASATTKWFYDSMAWLASKFPSHSLIYRFWSESARGFPTNKIIQIGSNGDAYALLPKMSGSYINTPDSSSLSIVGDIDIRAKIKITAFNGEPATIVSKWNTSRSYWIYIDTGGAIGFYWSADGTVSKNFTSSIISLAHLGNDIWIRVTMDVDNGAGGHDVKFYTSSDGVIWTQLGITRTGAGSTSIFNGTTECALGARSGSGDQGFWAGRIYSAEIRDGIDGDIVASPNMGMAFPAGKTTITDVEGNIWTFRGTTSVGNGSPCITAINASFPGSDVAWAVFQSTFDLHTIIEPQLSFINFSHNADTNVDYQDDIEALTTKLTTKYPNIGVVVCTQNPQKSPRTASNISNHAIRNRQIANVASKGNFGLIDAYRAYIETGNYTDYIDSDGVHPNVAGYALWAETVESFLFPAVP